MEYLGRFFSVILNWCNGLTGNFWWAIVVFTLITKIILLPVSVMVQRNSIKMVRMYPEMNRIKAKYFGNKDKISEEQYQLYKREHYHPMLDLIPTILQLIILMGVVRAIPGSEERSPLYMPILAALSALIMCLAQNRSNVLQSEQSRINQWGTLIFSVALSLYLGFFVSKGVAFYWICSNLLATVQMYILNFCINPKKYIDYEALAQSREELEKVEKLSAVTKHKRPPELVKREKADYKRFIAFENKQIVFYSEKNGFYKYFRDVIETIQRRTDVIIHYISSDPDDEIFFLTSDTFHTYYIEEKLMVLMMRMDADIVVMTTPDLQKYYIKRSMVRDDVEYVYMDHGMNSVNLMLRKGALDAFDTVFCANANVADELRAQEKVYGLKEKNLVPYGYAMIDNMIRAYEKQPPVKNDPPVILIAPSWQEDNIMDSCIDGLLTALRHMQYRVIVRPHPQYVRHYPEKLQALQAKYASFQNFTLQTDFSSNETVFNADVLVTDWSGTAYEYSFTTLKPCLFINTPMKVMNPDYRDIDVTPFDISIRNQIGIALEPGQIDQIAPAVHRLLHEQAFSPDSIAALRSLSLFNIGKAASVGADYLINRLIEKSRQP
ncbi:MAG: YidC/Oxa1 family membrane protein insertase [Oscillospiraceae bacterium]|nr:YidC/Oxa1 family membrane protein insertase [Oscillospiraceae bacterium]